MWDGAKGIVNRFPPLQKARGNAGFFAAIFEK